MNNGTWRKSSSPLTDKQNGAMSPVPAINIRDEEGLLDIIHRVLMTDKISSATSVEVAKPRVAGLTIALRGLSDRFFSSIIG
jgi:hypothetical protein